MSFPLLIDDMLAEQELSHFRIVRITCDCLNQFGITKRLNLARVFEPILT